MKTHSDGSKWVHLADIGYIDRDGQLYHMDRAKNIFMRTGFNVHPSKIKEFIMSIQGVENCEVIGFNHPKEQMVPVAFIQFDKTISPEEYDDKIEEIKKECYKNLDEIFLPYSFCIIDEMPLNLGGKIVASKLRELANIDYNKKDNKNTLILKLKK